MVLICASNLGFHATTGSTRFSHVPMANGTLFGRPQMMRMRHFLQLDHNKWRLVKNSMLRYVRLSAACGSGIFQVTVGLGFASLSVANTVTVVLRVVSTGEIFPRGLQYQIPDKVATFIVWLLMYVLSARLLVRGYQSVRVKLMVERYTRQNVNKYPV